MPQVQHGGAPPDPYQRRRDFCWLLELPGVQDNVPTPEERSRARDGGEVQGLQLSYDKDHHAGPAASCDLHRPQLLSPQEGEVHREVSNLRRGSDNNTIQEGKTVRWMQQLPEVQDDVSPAAAGQDCSYGGQMRR